MLRRSTLPRSSSSSLKQRQLSHLHSQLAQLEANLSDFENLIKITAYQAEYIKKLGILHGSLFMASHKVFEEEAQEQDGNEISNDDANDETNTYGDDEKIGTGSIGDK